MCHGTLWGLRSAGALFTPLKPVASVRWNARPSPALTENHYASLKLVFIPIIILKEIRQTVRAHRFLQLYPGLDRRAGEIRRYGNRRKRRPRVDHAGNMDVLVQGNSEEQEERLYSSELRDIERYSLGNQLRYGYFGRDASTQTDVIELPRVKELSEVTCTLLEDMKAVKSDLEYKHKFLQTDYEEKLQQHSLFLYMRINEKVLDLERQHKEKVAVLRKSFQQQLCDGLAVLRASYKKYYSRKEEKDQSSGSTKAGRLHELINEVQEKNAMIDYLSAQLKEYEEQAFEETSLQPYEDPEKELLAHENEKLKDEIDTLHVDIERLSDCLDCKDKQLEHLGLSLQTMKEKAENDQITINKLVAENENLKRDLHVEKDAGRSKLKKLKEEMEKEIQSMQTSSKKTQEENAIRLAKIEQEKQLMWEQEEILRKPAQPKMVKNGEQELLGQLEGVQRIEKQQRKQIESLRKQLDRTIRMWEKKFDILKQSFHAIKDEMFLRQMLQRQAATLHHASVSYTYLGCRILSCAPYLCCMKEHLILVLDLPPRLRQPLMMMLSMQRDQMFSHPKNPKYCLKMRKKRR
ncbi:uncharacterized protein C10orf67 homolog, mitochondrial isoform X2 [Lepisosteus oculatus]|uniref:uncharacterized protein C10orf67 homolog, mitochondrial isoform X2 n=1 Tax=Lepisosteus oculatus TaxID=7918 RepID=UPI003716A829